MKIKINLYTIFLLIFSLSSLVSCESDYLETDSTADVSYETAVASAESLRAIVSGMHRDMYTRTPYGQGYSGQTGAIVLFDSMCEDLVHTGVGLNWHMSVVRWQTQGVDTSGDVAYPWRFYYKMINNANIVIDAAATATGDSTIINRAVGEALTYRAWAYLFLVQIYGQRYVAGQSNTQAGVILRLHSGNEEMARSTVEEVYTQIHNDLTAAIPLLSSYSRTNKSHFDASVAKGLQARAYLVQGNWALAAQYAQDVIANTAGNSSSTYSLMTNTQYTSGFNDYNNSEWMWGTHIQDDQTDDFGNFGAYMSRNFNSSTIRTAPKAIYVPLYNMFPSTDVRLKNFDVTGLHTSLSLPSNYVKKPYTSQKFLAVSTTDSRSDVPYMRLAEMYLIAAEALARNNQESASKTLFTTLMQNRNPSYVQSTNTGAAYITEVLNSRRLELWGEGFRWFDLKRLNLPLVRNATGSNHVSTVINNVWTVPATDNRWTLLIPINEIQNNSLCTQNPI